jgi:DNA modification methylase
MTNVIDQREGRNWVLYNGDCVEVLRGLPDASVGYSVFSPPFSSLYTYSNSPRDMGNVRNHDEFFAHFAFLVDELWRVVKPGRLISFHCMLLPTSKVRDGHIGLYDFRGDLIRAFERVGFVFHSEVVIWKDPVTAMQRTKALGLLHKTIRTDSAMSRQGIPDYLVTVRKPGTNDEPIAHTAEEFPVLLWQRYASPVWVTVGDLRDDGFWDLSQDINPSDTLQHQSAREDDDERHICPLQLEVIRRAVRLWTKPGDLVLSPFAGIGSEGFVALQEGRRFVGAELKGSYFQQAWKNLQSAEQAQAGGLFAQAGK